MPNSKIAIESSCKNMVSEAIKVNSITERIMKFRKGNFMDKAFVVKTDARRQGI